MKKSKIRKNNISIAEFLGYKPAPEVAKGYYIKKGVGGMYVKDMKYHSSWECLMDVVEQITELGHGVVIEPVVGENVCTIRCYQGVAVALEIKIKNEDSIKRATYHAVVKFAVWYNKIEA